MQLLLWIVMSWIRIHVRGFYNKTASSGWPEMSSPKRVRVVGRASASKAMPSDLCMQARLSIIGPGHPLLQARSSPLLAQQLGSHDWPRHSPVHAVASTRCSQTRYVTCQQHSPHVCTLVRPSCATNGPLATPIRKSESSVS